ncbi:MAG: hypothetical protein KDA87_24050 [Planctomycetales bacterium]|nr:hypothetical protein [Planctomycetales bacterium]
MDQSKLTEFEQQLGRLEPNRSQIDLGALLFLAGQQSVRTEQENRSKLPQRVWQVWALSATAATLLLSWQLGQPQQPHPSVSTQTQIASDVETTNDDEISAANSQQRNPKPDFAAPRTVPAFRESISSWLPVPGVAQTEFATNRFHKLQQSIEQRTQLPLKHQARQEERPLRMLKTLAEMRRDLALDSPISESHSQPQTAWSRIFGTSQERPL